MASRLIGEHRYLVQAPPHFRAAMLRQLVRAVDAGLDERHLARALARVVGYADRDAHCELVRLAVQQAWADQRGGTCPECVGDGRGNAGHAFTCSARRSAGGTTEDRSAIQAAIVGSLTEARMARSTAATAATALTSPEGAGGAGNQLEPADVDVLAPFLDDVAPSPLDWDSASSDELMSGLEVALARMVAPRPAHNRVRALERAWVSLRPQVPPERRELLDLAALRLRQRLEQYLVDTRAS